MCFATRSGSTSLSSPVRLESLPPVFAPSLMNCRKELRHLGGVLCSLFPSRWIQSSAERLGWGGRPSHSRVATAAPVDAIPLAAECSSNAAISGEAGMVAILRPKSVRRSPSIALRPSSLPIALFRRSSLGMVSHGKELGCPPQHRICRQALSREALMTSGGL